MRVAALGVVVILLAGIGYGIHALSYLPRLTISKITVSGTERLEPALVEALIWSDLQDGAYHYLSRSDILVYPRAALERSIVTSFPRVKSAHVALTNPLSQNLAVTIEERKPFARWCAGDALATSTCYAMDNSGFIFAKMEPLIPADFSSQYIFWGGISDKPIGTTFLPGHMSGVVALLNVLSQIAHVTPSGVVVEDDQDLSVVFAEGFTLKVSFGEDGDAVARNLRLVLTSDALNGKMNEIEYVDLRFGNRVYYKLKGADQVESR